LRESITNTLVANASAAIADGATTETLVLALGDLPEFEFTMWWNNLSRSK
jgi:hypothetical protein